MVVLASHWSPLRTRLRVCAAKPSRSNRGLATSLASVVRRFAPRACSQPRQGVDQRPADALAGEFRIDEQHVDLVRALEAGEAGDCAVDHGDEGEGPSETGAERLLVVGARRPGFALLFVIVFGRQFLDARAKDLGAAFCVGREIGAKRDRAHRFDS